MRHASPPALAFSPLATFRFLVSKSIIAFLTEFLLAPGQGLSRVTEAFRFSNSGWLRAEASHSCDRKKSQKWGTEHLRRSGQLPSTGSGWKRHGDEAAAH